MQVKVNDMIIDFLDVKTVGEAWDHMEVIIYEDIYNLPKPYTLVREDKETNTFYVKVF